MKTVFYILALLVTAGAAYFSWDVNKKFQEEYALINSAYVDTDTGKKFDVGLVGLNDRHEATIKKTEDELKSEKEQLEAAKKELAERNAAIEVAQSNERTLQRTVGETEATLEEQQVKLDDLADAIKRAEEVVKTLANELGGVVEVNLENLPDVIQQLKQKKQALTDSNEELTELSAAADKNLAKNREEMARLVDRKSKRDSEIGRNSMEATVTAVNYEWGFVVVGAGSRSGFTPQTTVLVKRDGRVLGQLNPSSIEPNQTIFEIDFDSMAPGVRIRPGDRVLLSQPRT